MILELKNNTNSYSFEVEDLNYGEKLYYKFQIPATDVEDGKYNMILMDGDDVIAEEQVCFGNFKSETIQYNRGENVYIDVKLDTKIEEEVVATIDSIESIIVPTGEFDAMKKVVVNAQPVYDNGYNEGENIGYNSGYTAGEVEQKSKLTNITIYENGTYTREDGYKTVVVDVPDTNGSYDEGYQAGIDYASENAEEIAAANAIDLVVTDFKTYYTKYSDNIVYPDLVTGIYPDGENFYNDISIKDSQTYFSGEYQITPSSKIEIWWNNQNENDNLGADNFIFGFKLFLSIYRPLYKYNYTARFFSTNEISFTFEYVGWHHIVLSANGLFINDKKIGDFNINLGVSDVGNNFRINNYANGGLGTNGSYGMIKLDDTIIIPTADGFLNTNTNELLTKNNNVYIYSNNNPVILDNLIKSVDVQPKINVPNMGLKFAYSTFKEIPEIFDFNGITDMNNMFYNCTSLTSIPEIDTSSVSYMNSMFYYCSSLISIPEIDTSNVRSMYSMFDYCTSLTSIPEIDTSNVTEMSNMFRSCNLLTSIPALQAGELNMTVSYQGVFGSYELPNITEFGGFQGLKKQLIGSYNLAKLPNLNYQSCINVLNGLYDFTGNGETPTSQQANLQVNRNFINLVGDEISIGTSKGWNIYA